MRNRLGLDAGFAPALRQLPNYGQFGFLVVYLAFFGMLCGASASLLNKLSYTQWLPIYIGIRVAAFLLEPEVVIGKSWADVDIIAQLIVDTAVLIACYSLWRIARCGNRR